MAARMKLAHMAVLAVLLGGSLAQAEARLEKRLQLIEERPSFGASVALLTVGGLLGTAGTAATGFGLVMIALAGQSVWSGIAVAIGVIFAAPGAAVMIAGIAMMYAGAQKLRAHNIANEEMEARDDLDWGRADSATAAPPQMIALATF